MLRFDDDLGYPQLTEPVDASAFAARRAKEQAVETQSKGAAGSDLDVPLHPAPNAPHEDSALDRLPLRDRLRLYLLGPAPAEEVTPYQPDPDLAPAVPPSVWARYGRLALCAAAGFTGSLLIVGSAPVWYNAAPSWRLTVPGIPHPGTSVQSGTFFVTGLALLILGWVGLVGRAERAPLSARGRLWAVVAVGADLLHPRPVLHAAAEPRQLQLRRPGRDGQPGHRPQRQRAGCVALRLLLPPVRSHLA